MEDCCSRINRNDLSGCIYANNDLESTFCNLILQIKEIIQQYRENGGQSDSYSQYINQFINLSNRFPQYLDNYSLLLPNESIYKVLHQKYSDKNVLKQIYPLISYITSTYRNISVDNQTIIEIVRIIVDLLNNCEDKGHYLSSLCFLLRSKPDLIHLFQSFGSFDVSQLLADLLSSEEELTSISALVFLLLVSPSSVDSTTVESIAINALQSSNSILITNLSLMIIDNIGDILKTSINSLIKIIQSGSPKCYLIIKYLKDNETLIKKMFDILLENRQICSFLESVMSISDEFIRNETINFILQIFLIDIKLIEPFCTNIIDLSLDILLSGNNKSYLSKKGTAVTIMNFLSKSFDIFPMIKNDIQSHQEDLFTDFLKYIEHGNSISIYYCNFLYNITKRIDALLPRFLHIISGHEYINIIQGSLLTCKESHFLEEILYSINIISEMAPAKAFQRFLINCCSKNQQFLLKEKINQNLFDIEKSKLQNEKQDVEIDRDMIQMEFTAYKEDANNIITSQNKTISNLKNDIQKLKQNVKKLTSDNQVLNSQNIDLEIQVQRITPPSTETTLSRNLARTEKALQKAKQEIETLKSRVVSAEKEREELKINIHQLKQKMLKTKSDLKQQQKSKKISNESNIKHEDIIKKFLTKPEFIDLQKAG